MKNNLCLLASKSYAYYYIFIMKWVFSYFLQQTSKSEKMINHHILNVRVVTRISLQVLPNLNFHLIENMNDKCSFFLSHQDFISYCHYYRYKKQKV